MGLKVQHVPCVHIHILCGQTKTRMRRAVSMTTLDAGPSRQANNEKNMKSMRQVMESGLPNHREVLVFALERCLATHAYTSTPLA